MVLDSVEERKELHTQNGDDLKQQVDTTFGTDGFSLGSNNDVNKSSTSFVSWNWWLNICIRYATGSGTGKSYSGVNTTRWFFNHGSI